MYFYFVYFMIFMVESGVTAGATIMIQTTGSEKKVQETSGSGGFRRLQVQEAGGSELSSTTEVPFHEENG